MPQHELIFPPMPIEDALKMRANPQLYVKKRKFSDNKFMISAIALVAASLAIVLLEMYLVGSAGAAHVTAPAVVVVNK